MENEADAHGNGKLDGTRSLPAISVFRANEAASQAPIANSNSNHAPCSVRLRTKIKLCADRVETHCPRTWEEVLLHLARHISNNRVF